MLKSFFKIALPILIMSCILIGIKRYKKQTDHTKITIGIIKTASHPALDASLQGFVNTINKNSTKPVEFIIRNGEGSISNIYAIAQAFHADQNITAFFALATPAVQAICALEKERPIFIAAVTYPHSLGILDNATNVCGSTDLIDINKELDSMLTLLPQTSNIAILCNNAEANSVSMAQEMKKELDRKNISTTIIGISTESDIAIGVAKALRTADLLLTPVDNMVANSITLIATMAQKANKPLIVSDNLLVQYGALMACGVDYYQNGVESGLIALQILKKEKKPYEFPIKPTNSNTIVVNAERMAHFGITMPSSWKNVISVNESKEKQ